MYNIFWNEAWRNTKWCVQNKKNRPCINVITSALFYNPISSLEMARKWAPICVQYTNECSQLHMGYIYFSLLFIECPCQVLGICYTNLPCRSRFYPLRQASQHLMASCTSSATSVEPLKICMCGYGYCRVKISWSRQNPGRAYYTCPRPVVS